MFDANAKKNNTQQHQQKKMRNREIYNIYTIKQHEIRNSNYAHTAAHIQKKKETNARTLTQTQTQTDKQDVNITMSAVAHRAAKFER